MRLTSSPRRTGIAKLKQQANWLKSEYPDAAASLLEGLEETFTVNRLKLTPSLMRCLCDHQHHRESERCGASRDPSRQSLPRRRDGAALDGDRIPGSGEVVPQDPGPSSALGAWYGTRSIGRAG